MQRPLAAAALLATLAFGGAAHAAPYTILLYETPADLALRAETSPRGRDYWAAWDQFAKVLSDAKAIRGGAPLQAASQGRVFGVQSTPSPVGLPLSGYVVIEATDLDAAAALAAQAPSVRRGGGAEVRATYPAPTMSH